MARKVFDDESDTPQDPPARAATPRRKPLVRGGAAAPKYIQGSTQSANDRSYEEIPVDQIQTSRIEDRIDLTEGIEDLMASIRENGQQIPIIVRIVNGARPYEIVAGRRRLEATRRLGRSVIRGFVTRMSDEEAFRTQGIENSSRLETSFIERARTAASASDAGFSTRDIAEFLNVSHTLVSFMTRIYRQVGEELVLAIGPARQVGRRKWEDLIQQMEARGLDSATAATLVDRTLGESSERFEALVLHLAGREAKAPRPAPAQRRVEQQMTFQNGHVTCTRKARKLEIATDRTIPDGMLEYLSEKLEGLIEDYLKAQQEKK